MIRFEHIEYLYFLLMIPVFTIIFALMIRWKKSALRRFGDTNIIGKLIPDQSNGLIITKFVILMTAFVFLVLGIANPQTGSKLEKIHRKGIDIMIALDVSNSMLAQDIRPDRLSRAKQSINKLIDQLEGDRIGIIVFAGNAYTQLPITTDYAAAKLFLSTVNPDIVPTQGTAIGEALELAIGAFSQDDKNNKAIVVITDGENHEGNATKQSKAAAELGIRVFSIGMGQPDGAPIPVYNRKGNMIGYKKDKEGQTIITKLNVDMLRQIASAGNGIYVNATNSNTGLSNVLDEINKMEKTDLETKMFTDYEDQFQYFIGLGLILLLLEYIILERKGRLARKIRIFEVKEK